MAESVFNNAQVVRYEHRDVKASRQVYTDQNGALNAVTDCSGFVSYVVNHIAPRHYYVVRQREPSAAYPQAKIWAHYFDTLRTDQPDRGWLGLRWSDIDAGDIIAWTEGETGSSGNTGHVMIAAGKPSQIKQTGGYRYVEVSVIDCSSVYHFSLESLPPAAKQQHRDGLGKGTVRILLSADNSPVGYWEGTYWGEGDRKITEPTESKFVRFARMVSIISNDNLP